MCDFYLFLLIEIDIEGNIYEDLEISKLMDKTNYKK